MLYTTLTLDAMQSYYPGCYALSTAASFPLLRCLVVFLSHLEYVFLLLSKKGANYFATALIGYTDRGSIK